MRRLLLNIGEFGWDVVKIATVGGRWAGWVTKSVVYLLAFLFAVANETKVRVHLLTDGGKGDGEMVLAWPSLGWSVFLVVVLLVIAVSAGMAWVRFKRLEVGTVIEHDPSNHYHRLPIRNVGFVEVEVPVCVVAFANSDGIVRGMGLQLPIESSWMHEPLGPRPKLAKGKWYKVDVFRVQDPSQLRDVFGLVNYAGIGEPVLVLTGLHDRFLTVATASTVRARRLWVALSVGSSDDVRWFSISPTDSPYSYRVEAEDPPIAVRNPTDIAVSSS